ncbi:unnamed protein product [Ceutorhynchus assimilis]|uniref:AB hydrolase-1 domain-containing protein n=1 Tax=Ceutorhynchus assimilis TaxID=467358 RepID=A0A9N9MT65_9CUCU|nr:unnamed protein product [Ceutorhynchus assimilis]
MAHSCLKKNIAPNNHDNDYLLSEEHRKKKRKNLCRKTLIWSTISFFILISLAFIIIWILIPISFMLSLPFQTFMVFIPIASPRHANFNQPENFGLEGVHNFYISTRDYYDYNTSTTIGAWLILPENFETKSNNVSEILQNTQHDIAIYLHGVFANRAKAIKQYGVLRKHFLIVAIDHRGYGDSGQNVRMSEAGIVHDHLQIFDWVKSLNSKSDVYYWGHSLGTGLTSHTVKMLKNQKNITPKGMILEASFTAYQDVIINNPLGKIFTWLSYFNATIINPLDNNGFHFKSIKNIISIDCPIMILHAEDDSVVPYFLGERLAKTAQKNRKNDQGVVRFHGFSADYGFGHNDILMYSEIGGFIEDFKGDCRNFTSVS